MSLERERDKEMSKKRCQRERMGVEEMSKNYHISIHVYHLLVTYLNE